MTTEKIVSEIEVLLIQLKESLGLHGIEYGNKLGKQGISTRKTDRKLSGLTGKINELAIDGFFKQQKTISDIQKKLKDEGINKPTTSLMPPLLFLISRKILKREKPDKGVYKYYQR